MCYLLKMIALVFHSIGKTIFYHGYLVGNLTQLEIHNLFSHALIHAYVVSYTMFTHTRLNSTLLAICKHDIGQCYTYIFQSFPSILNWFQACKISNTVLGQRHVCSCVYFCKPCYNQLMTSHNQGCQILGKEQYFFRQDTSLSRKKLTRLPNTG